MRTTRTTRIIPLGVLLLTPSFLLSQYVPPSGGGGGAVTSVFTRTGAVTAQSGDYTAAQVGLSSVTNDVQTKASIMPNTAPSAAQVPVGNAGGTAYAPVTISGDCSITSLGAITCTKLNNISVATAATASTIAERNASGELIAVNTVATGKTPMATDTSVVIGQTPLTTRGDLLTVNSTPALARLGKGTQYQTLQGGASDLGFDAVHLDQATAVTGVLPNANTTATNANTASTIVARDASGNFSAGTITANLTGNATGLSATLGVASGGTSLTTLTAHALYAGNGTSAPTAVGPDSSTTKALFSAGSSADPAFRAIATTDFPGISGPWWLPLGGGYAPLGVVNTTSPAGTANDQASLTIVTIPVAISFGHIVVNQIGGSTNSGTKCGFALYSLDGQTRVYTTGGIACDGANGVKSTAVSGTVYPGSYYLLSCTSNSAATNALYEGVQGTANLSNAGNANQNWLGTLASACATGVPNSTITPASISTATTTNIPIQLLAP